MNLEVIADKTLKSLKTSNADVLCHANQQCLKPNFGLQTIKHI